MSRDDEQEPLTQKQEAFVIAYIETGNASEAYRRAYNVGEDTKPETIWESGSRTLNLPHVSARVEFLRKQARDRLLVTVDSITRELDEARALALADPKGAAAAISASMGKAKLHGLLVDKNEHSGPGGGAIPVEVREVRFTFVEPEAGRS